MKHTITVLTLAPLLWAAVSLPSMAQTRIERTATNSPLSSLQTAAKAASNRGVQFIDQLYRVPNKPLKSDLRTKHSELQAADPLIQAFMGSASTNIATQFEGASNADNAAAVGFRVAPPDTDGDVGPNHYVQMINLVTTIFDKNGNVLDGPFPSNAFWAGAGGLCEPFNQGDPIVVYDENDDRWLVTQFAFDDNFTTFAQCVAVSQTGDPTGGYNRYEFSFDGIGFPDYPKHGITSESITMMANIFAPRGPFFSFTGTFVGVMDKSAMYAGEQSVLMIGDNLGSSQFGFVAGDLDDPTGSAGFVPALFATAMSSSNLFDIWQFDVNWNAGNPSASASVNKIAAIPISPYDPDLCSASREACIPQPNTGQRFEALSDRLMHRLQIRDFGSYRSMLAAHTVDVGGGRAGIRWYEMRENGGAWALHQEGTYAPNDGLNRWVPSIAMNAAGDIGLGYLVSGSSEFMSVGVAGQSASASGTGTIDGMETICRAGVGSQTGAARAGDYSSTNVDPLTDTFWHTNEYMGLTNESSVPWKTSVCEFSVTGGTAGSPPAAPSALNAVAASSSAIDIDWTDNATDEDEFRIERATSGGSFAQIATVGANTMTYSSTDLSASTAYDYRVRACNIHGCSGYSNVATATTEDAGPATYVYVANILTGTANVGKGTKRGTAAVTVLDNVGNPVAGLTVTGDFSGTFNEAGKSASTGADGVALVETEGSKKGGISVGFCVQNVTGGLPYDESASGAYDCGPGTGFARRIGYEDIDDLPSDFNLDQNYPNPFNPTTQIAYSIREAGAVRLSVYNMLGQEVARLVDGRQDAGSYQVDFDASGLSGGIYVYALESGGLVATRKMTLLK